MMRQVTYCARRARRTHTVLSPVQGAQFIGGARDGGSRRARGGGAEQQREHEGAAAEHGEAPRPLARTAARRLRRRARRTQPVVQPSEHVGPDEAADVADGVDEGDRRVAHLGRDHAVVQRPERPCGEEDGAGAQPDEADREHRRRRRRAAGGGRLVARGGGEQNAAGRDEEGRRQRREAPGQNVAAARAARLGKIVDGARDDGRDERRDEAGHGGGGADGVERRVRRENLAELLRQEEDDRVSQQRADKVLQRKEPRDRRAHDAAQRGAERQRRRLGVVVVAVGGDGGDQRLARRLLRLGLAGGVRAR